MKRTFDIVIVGGGIIGLAAAYTFAGQGCCVALLDKRDTGREASWAGGGILFPLLPWDYPQDYASWVIESARRYGTICDALCVESDIDPQYRRHGMVLLQAPTPPVYQGVDIETCQFLGQEAFFLPEVAQVRNPRILKSLKTACMRKGVTFFEGEPLMAFIRQGRTIEAAKTPRQSLHAKKYLLCAGAWSAELIRSFLPTLACLPVRGQMLLFAFQKPPFDAIVFGDGVYAVPREDGHLLLGATVEPSVLDALPTAQGYRFLLAKSRQLGLDLPESAMVAQWGGLRPAVQNRLWPIIDRHPNIENLFINVGHFRYGLTTAFASAAVALDCIRGQKTLPAFHW